jgi:GNAT superfamily N-acetyltransferase
VRVTDNRVRPIAPGDVSAVVAMVHELAAYERAADECHLAEEQLHAALFTGTPALFGHVAIDPAVDPDGAPVGFALWFLNYSTWRGAHGIYLEDLYVKPEARGDGLARALLSTLAGICIERGYGRLDWWVLNWNTPAREVYRALGAEALEEWIPYRIDGEPLARLAGGARIAP